MNFKYVIPFIIVACLQAETLDNIINSSIKASPIVNRQIKFYDGVLQDLDIAKSDNLPTLDYRGEIGRESIDRELSNKTGLNYWKNNLTLRQNLFRGYKTQSEIRQNEARISEAAYTVLDRANTVALDTATSYIDVLKENELTKLFKENVQNHIDILKKIEERTKAGVGRKSEVQQTQSRLSLAYSNLIVQQNNFEDTLTEYHYNVGRHYDKIEFITPTLNYQPPENIDKAAYIALINNPSVKALKSTIIAKTAEYKKAGSEYYPILDAVASADWENNADGISGRKDSISIGLVARWNLYRGGADEAGRLKALEALTEARRNLRRIQRDVIKQARLAYMGYRMYRPQIEYLKSHVNSSKETLASYIDEYSLGRRDLLSILDAQKEYNAAKQTLITAQYNLLNSRYRLASSTNELLNEVKSDLSSKLLLTSIEEDLTNDKNFGRNVLCDNPLNRENLNEYDCKESSSNIDIGYLSKEIEVVPPEPEPKKVMPIAPKLIKLSTINFDYNSYSLSPEAESILEENAKKLNNKQSYNLQITGYTDSKGSKEYNRLLSKGRANSVKNRLLELGVKAEKIEILPMGEDNPLAGNDTKENRAKNRRVGLKIIESIQ